MLTTNLNPRAILVAFACAWISLNSQAQSPQAPLNPPSAQHPLAQHLQNQGARKCVAKVDTVAKFVTAQMRSGSLVFPVGVKPDESVFSFSTEIPGAAGSGYVTSMFAPTANDCTAVFETFNFHPGKCEDAMTLPVFARFKEVAQIEQNIKVIALDATVRVMFMPAGPNGCMVIKKQILP